MSEEELKFKCQDCGKEFEADPDTMVECGLSGVLSGEDEEIPEGAFTEEQLLKMNEYELKELQLTPETLKELLNNREITTGGICICKECQG